MIGALATATICGGAVVVGCCGVAGAVMAACSVTTGFGVGLGAATRLGFDGVAGDFLATLAMMGAGGLAATTGAVTAFTACGLTTAWGGLGACLGSRRNTSKGGAGGVFFTTS